MKGYVLSLLVVGMVGAIVSVLAPEGERGGIGRLVRFASGLCLIAVCMSPMASLIERLSRFDFAGALPDATDMRQEYESAFENGYLLAEEANTREGIKRLLKDRFAIDESEVEVSLRLTDEKEGRRIERILITLYGQAIWKDTGEIERYLEALFGCETVTAIG